MATKEVYESLGGLYLIGVQAGFLPLMALYAFGQASDPSNVSKFLLYGITGIIGLAPVMLRIYFLNEGVFDERPELQGFNNLTLHSPENTWVGRNMPFFQDWLNMTGFFVIVGMFLGFVVSTSGTFGTGTVSLVQGSGVSGTGSLFFAVEPANTSETLFFNVFVLQGLVGVLHYVFYRRGLSHVRAIVLSKLISVMVSTLVFLVYHRFAYPGQEQELLGIFLLGLVTNLFTALTNSVIPALLVHGSNNFFDYATRMSILSQEGALIIAVTGALLGGLILTVRNLRD